MNKLPSFKETNQALYTLQSLGTASESHGLLCALLSFNNQIRESAWVDSLLNSHIESSNIAAQQAYQVLTQLFQVTSNAFNESDREIFEFPILIPDDDTLLEERIDGLSEWCQGYLTGLHLMGIKLEGTHYSQDLQEALKDILAISEIEFTPEDETDKESELRFMQLTEHVKVAALTIESELKEDLLRRDEHTTLH